MKRTDIQELLSKSTPELQEKVAELQAELVKARQERFMQDKTDVDVKRAYKVRKQIKMVKAELTRREIEAAQASREE